MWKKYYNLLNLAQIASSGQADLLVNDPDLLVQVDERDNTIIHVWNFTGRYCSDKKRPKISSST